MSDPRKTMTAARARRMWAERRAAEEAVVAAARDRAVSLALNPDVQDRAREAADAAIERHVVMGHEAADADQPLRPVAFVRMGLLPSMDHGRAFGLSRHDVAAQSAYVDALLGGLKAQLERDGFQVELGNGNRYGAPVDDRGLWVWWDEPSVDRAERLADGPSIGESKDR